MTRKLSQPIPNFVFVMIFGVVFGFVLSLIVAAFLKRQAPTPATPPLV